MNLKLVESLVQVILSLPDDEQQILIKQLSSSHVIKFAQKSEKVESIPSKQVDIEATFTTLANQWLEEARGISSTNEMSMHPAYQQIIGMGEAVVPLLLREIEKKSGRWFWALKCITREDPVPPESRGKTQEMIKAWLEWGMQKGYNAFYPSTHDIMKLVFKASWL